MTIRTLKEYLDADVLCGEEELDREVHSAFGCDMMSDVLAYAKDQAVLLTGLINPQVVRTAEMMDMACIVFVRSNRPNEAILTLAEGAGIVVLATNLRMYESCGRLFMNGLQG